MSPTADSRPRTDRTDRFEASNRIRGQIEPHLESIGSALLQDRKLTDETTLRAEVERQLKEVIPAGFEVQAVTVDTTYDSSKRNATLTMSVVIKKGDHETLVSKSFFDLDRSGFEEQEIEQVAERVRAILSDLTEPVTLESVNNALETLGYTGFRASGAGKSQAGGRSGVSHSVHFSIEDGTRVLDTEGYQAVPHLHRATVSIQAFKTPQQAPDTEVN